jgi:acyl dehydratase
MFETEAAMALTWDSINEGDQLPELRKKPDVEQLVKYAGGSGDFNPLHYDYQFPQAKELGSIIVHGRFKYASLGELVSNWLGHAGRVRRISCQYRGMDFPTRDIVCREGEREVSKRRSKFVSSMVDGNRKGKNDP